MITRTRLRIGALVVILLAMVAGARELGAPAIRAAVDAAESGRWLEAEEILGRTSWLPSSSVHHYNAGVVAYYQGDLPRAIAHWRVARELAPRQADIVHNLAIARKELATDPPPPIGAVYPWSELLTPTELGVLAALGWAGFSWTMIAARRRRDLYAAAGACLIAAGITTAVAAAGRTAWVDRPIGVVAGPVVARDGAELAAGERFELVAGSEVGVHARRGAFVLVEDGRGRRGWVIADRVHLARSGRHGISPAVSRVTSPTEETDHP